MKYEIFSNDTSAVIDTFGAELHSVKHNGIEYLWQGSEEFWSEHAPVCFPITGALENNEGTAFGKKCKMTRHGIAKHYEFQMKEKSDNKITFSLRANEKTMEQYPFDFELLITYSINGSTLKTHYEVINHGDCEMPFCIGGHPAFNCPLGDTDYSDWYIEFEKEETAACMRADENGFHDVNRRSTEIRGKKMFLSHRLFDDDSMSFNTLVSRSATLKSDKNEHGVKLDYKDFPNLLIWSNMGDAPFVAVEPWHGLSYCTDDDGTFEHKRDIIILKPNERRELSFDITLF